MFVYFELSSPNLDCKNTCEHLHDWNIYFLTNSGTYIKKNVFSYDHPTLSARDSDSKRIRRKIIIIQCDPNEVHVLKQNGAGV